MNILGYVIQHENGQQTVSTKLFNIPHTAEGYQLIRMTEQDIIKVFENDILENLSLTNQ